jgi:glucosylglycerate synthase
MASTPSQPAATSAAQTASGSPPESLLVSLAPLSHDAFESTLTNLSQAFAGSTVLVATPDFPAAATEAFQQDLSDDAHDARPGPGSNGSNGSQDWASRFTNLHLLTEPHAVPPPGAWVLTAADFLNTYKLAQQHNVSSCLLLGAEAQSLTLEALRSLAAAVGGTATGNGNPGADLAVPRYDLGPRDGLVNSAILYPISRAVYGARPRFPLAIDLGLSLRMAERLATAAQKFTATGQNDALLWPVAEAAVAGYTIAEVNTGTRAIPQPTNTDLNSLLARITASLFTDIEARAAFWQRSRIAQPGARGTMPAQTATDAFAELDVQPMLDAFRLAYSNLQEIWSLVLPPNSLLGLKRLSTADPETFRMPDSLWVRVIYDFLLAFRLRTINRGHLLGALTPLYLAWVASHILYARSGVDPERHIEEIALAFEFDKPYLVSRWRWPDRFNP